MGWLKWKGGTMPKFMILEKVPPIVRFEQTTNFIEMPSGIPIVYQSKSFKTYNLTVNIGFRPGVWDKAFFDEYSAFGKYSENDYKIMTVDEIEDIQFDSVYNWLSGAGTLTFSNDSERYYNAVCNSSIVPERVSRKLRKLPVQFTLMPFRYLISESSHEITFESLASGEKQAWLSYTGTYPSEPTIKLYGSGDLGFQWGTKGYKVKSVTDYCVIDVPTHRVYDKNGNVILNKTEGDITEISVSNGTYIKAGANITKLELLENTRWR